MGTGPSHLGYNKLPGKFDEHQCLRTTSLCSKASNNLKPLSAPTILTVLGINFCVSWNYLVNTTMMVHCIMPEWKPQYNDICCLALVNLYLSIYLSISWELFPIGSIYPTVPYFFKALQLVCIEVISRWFYHKSFYMAGPTIFSF